MNAHVQIRQISQYPDKDPVFPDDRVVLQEGGLGGPYRSATVQALVGTAMMLGGDFKMMPGGNVMWEGGLDATLTWDGGSFFFGSPVAVPSLASCGAITMGGHMLATIDDLNGFIANGSVWSFNGRTGEVVLNEADILRAGAAPVRSPCFSGWVQAPSPWDVTLADNTVVTANWVRRVIASQPSTAPTPPTGDSGNAIATTAFVDDALSDYAPLYSPHLIGIPTAPTAATGTSSTQLATTAFVQNAVVSGVAGVSSFNTRTGAVTLTAADVTGVGGAVGSFLPIAGGTLTGTLNIGSGVYQFAGKTFGYVVPSGGGDNVFVGAAGNKTLTGGGNYGGGPGAIMSLTSGGTNVAVGTNALTAETTGNSNAAMGYGALGTQVGGSSNVAVGVNSGYDIANGSNNICIGFNSGRGLATGGGCTVIGANITGLLANLTNAIVLGSGGAIHYDYSSTTASVHTFDAAVRLSKGYTVATLPAAGPIGCHCYVTDGAASLAWGATVTGGGSTPYLVWYNGSAWTVVGK